MDGKCAAAIVNHAVSQFTVDLEMMPVQYGQEIDIDDIDAHIVYMVDFSLQPFSLMHKLAKRCNLIWIDHHKSAIEQADKTEFHCYKRVTEVGKAGCELAWEYAFPYIKMPHAVHLLGRYDVWDHGDSDTLPFQYAMRTYSMPPDSHAWWECLFELDDLSRYIEYGQTILLYIQSHNTVYAKAAFETDIEGYRVIALNRMYTNSQMFEGVYDSSRHDAMLTFGWCNGQWTVSLYATKDNVDVSEIARQYGGGGHKGAAGFQCDALPFDLR